MLDSWALPTLEGREHSTCCPWSQQARAGRGGSGPLQREEAPHVPVLLADCAFAVESPRT